MKKFLAFLLLLPVSALATTVCWTPPTLNADGSVLDDLTRYEVALSPNPELDGVVLLDTQVEATANCYDVDESQLGDGLWYFAVRACDEVDNCAEWSNVIGPKSVDTIAPAKINDLSFVEN